MHAIRYNRTESWMNEWEDRKQKKNHPFQNNTGIAIKTIDNNNDNDNNINKRKEVSFGIKGIIYQLRLPQSKPPLNGTNKNKTTSVLAYIYRYMVNLTHTRLHTVYILFYKYVYQVEKKDYSLQEQYILKRTFTCCRTMVLPSQYTRSEWSLYNHVSKQWEKLTDWQSLHTSMHSHTHELLQDSLQENVH